MVGEYAADDDGLARQFVGVSAEVFFCPVELQTVRFQPFHQLSVDRIGEVGYNALRYFFTDFIDVFQLFEVCVFQLFDVRKGLGYFLGNRFSHEAYAQCKEHSFEWHFFTCRNTVDYVFCRFFAHPFQVLDVIGFELV